MKWLSLTLFILSSFAHGQLITSPFEPERSPDPASLPFFRHITTPAKTLRPGKVSFENFPGASSNTSFLIGSLSIGVFPGLQVGLVPLFLAFEGHRYNFNFKANFVAKKYFHFGLGYSQFSVRLTDMDFITEQNGSITQNPYVDLGFAFLAFNYREPSSPFSYGLNFSQLVMGSNSKVLRDILNEQARHKNDWAFDINYAVKPLVGLSLGFGEMRADTFELRSPFAFGYGLSLNWLRPRAEWFTRLTAGVNYFPSTDEVRGLFSFDL